MERDLICYCFGYSEEDIIRDVMADGGTSSILERILSKKKKGARNCTFNHPRAGDASEMSAVLRTGQRNS